MRRSNYLPHVDGLRALAVLVVIFFHLDIPSFQGGYVGVDVFFVISGFLITGILREELEKSGRLDLRKFYFRRMRRLIPALLVTLSVTFLFSALIFSPVHFQRIGGALSASLLSVSNFYFWLEADYFDVGANLKPFLHTWSLSVEEQFYLFWPLMLVVCHKYGGKMLTLIFLVLMFFVSIALNLIFYDGQSQFVSDNIPALADLIADGKSTLFFMLPFRLFEFSVGALLVWVVSHSFNYRIINETFFLVGLGLILYSVFYFDESLIFPYWNALIPCVGAALVILSGPSTVSGAVLRTSGVVGIGLISYSLYLVHWPIIVFLHYLNGELVWLSKLLILVLTFILAFLLYRFVEKPFRAAAAPPKQSVISAGVALVSVILFLSGLHSYHTSGWKWRIDDSVVNLDHVENSSAFHRQYYGGSGYPYYGPVATDSPADIVVVGDSHGRHYAEGVSKVLSEPNDYGLFIAAGTSCFHLPNFTRTTDGQNWDQICPASLDKALEYIENSNQAPLVILSHNWNFQMSVAGRLKNGSLNDATVEPDQVVSGVIELAKLIGDAKLVVIGNVPGSGHNLYDVFTRPRPLIFSDFDPDGFLFHSRNAELERTNLKLKEAALKTGEFSFIDPFNYLCIENHCRNVDGQRRLLYSDTSHLSKYGSIYLIEAIKSELLQLLDRP
ncbi:acyltransferase family protein [Marinobacter apostichopi]|uniref:acyltransferase family protein n=1 Tax=Marinobacter apostichopi TaxID=3035454 RepID=UPI002572ABA8|nr:acyltransferase family protein [Marinobacter sp. LA51]